MTIDVRATVIQTRGLIVLRHRDDDRFFKGGGNHRGSKGLIKDGCKQTSELISTGPQNTDINASGPTAFLTFTRFSSLWISSSDISSHRCFVCCFLMRWSAESRCCDCIQSGLRKSLTRWPATDLLSPLQRIYFQRNRWSSVPATCAESHWAEKDTIFSPLIGAALTAHQRA